VQFRVAEIVDLPARFLDFACCWGRHVATARVASSASWKGLRMGFRKSEKCASLVEGGYVEHVQRLLKLGGPLGKTRGGESSFERFLKEPGNEGWKERTLCKLESDDRVEIVNPCHVLLHQRDRLGRQAAASGAVSRAYERKRSHVKFVTLFCRTADPPISPATFKTAEADKRWKRASFDRFL
jgi:hypothetical protein